MRKAIFFLSVSLACAVQGVVQMVPPEEKDEAMSHFYSGIHSVIFPEEHEGA